MNIMRRGHAWVAENSRISKATVVIEGRKELSGKISQDIYSWLITGTQTLSFQQGWERVVMTVNSPRFTCTTCIPKATWKVREAL